MTVNRDGRRALDALVHTVPHVERIAACPPKLGYAAASIRHRQMGNHSR
jgi:hypothetical protein